MNKIATITSVTFCATFVAASLFAQDPFATPKSTSTKAKSPVKTVVHTPTLDLCLHWLDLNSGMVRLQKKVYQAKKNVADLPNDSPDAKKEELEQKLTQLRAALTKIRNKLNSIPMDSTFDLERWHQFKLQLRDRRAAETEQLEIIDFINRENDRLRNENKKLKEEIASLSKKK